MVDTDDHNSEIMNVSLRELNRYPITFDVEKVAYLLIRLKKLNELTSLLSVRFLHVQQMELQSQKDKINEYSHLKENEYFNKLKQESVTPILGILESIYGVIVDQKKPTLDPIAFFSSLIDAKDDKNILDYMRDEILKPLSIAELNQLKSKIIGTVMIHDNEKLHLSIFDWLNSHELYDDLKDVTSKYYSQYIEQFERQTEISIHQVELVCKHLQGKLKINPTIIYRANQNRSSQWRKLAQQADSILSPYYQK